MPHYWFDLSDNGTPQPDPEGLPFDSPETARMEGLRGLVELARDQPLVEGRELICTVRDGDGPLYRLALVMNCEPIRS